MILFVFEGEKREPQLYRTIEKLYIRTSDEIICCSYGNNIYDLYRELKEMGEGGDLVDVLRARLAKRGDTTLNGFRSPQFSEIYLFFDYDFHNTQLSLEDINMRLGKMLSFFSEETENGKLYINYPMIESIRYTKELPDAEYINYTVERRLCSDFKARVHKFSYYHNLDHLIFKNGEEPNKQKYDAVRNNWQHLRRMNVNKAHYLVTGNTGMPTDKATICQAAIFLAQQAKFVNNGERVAVLNSLPLFLYDYLK